MMIELTLLLVCESLSGLGWRLGGDGAVHAHSRHVVHVLPLAPSRAGKKKNCDKRECGHRYPGPESKSSVRLLDGSHRILPFDVYFLKVARAVAPSKFVTCLEI